MADKRINFGVGVMLGFIFVVGGHNGVSHLSSIERYDPHQNQWTVCRPMKEPRTGRTCRTLRSALGHPFRKKLSFEPTAAAMDLHWLVCRALSFVCELD